MIGEWGFQTSQHFEVLNVYRPLSPDTSAIS